MYRFRPTQYEMKAYPINAYPAKCKQAAAIMLMIMNNLDKRVAQFPHELVTYHEYISSDFFVVFFFYFLYYILIFFESHQIWWKWFCVTELGSISFSYEVFIRNV